MSTGDHLTLGAVAALAALGLASRRRRGSRAVDMGLYKRMIALNYPPSQAWSYVGGTGSPPGTTAKAPSRQSVTQAPKTTRKKTTRKKTTSTKASPKKTTSTKASPKKAKVTAKQQGMINQILEKMGNLTKTEKKVYTTKLRALTEDQVRQLQTQCDQEAA
jgi:hypothetical protein